MNSEKDKRHMLKYTEETKSFLEETYIRFIEDNNLFGNPSAFELFLSFVLEETPKIKNEPIENLALNGIE